MSEIISTCVILGFVLGTMIVKKRNFYLRELYENAENIPVAMTVSASFLFFTPDGIFLQLTASLRLLKHNYLTVIRNDRMNHPSRRRRDTTCNAWRDYTRHDTHRGTYKIIVITVRLRDMGDIICCAKVLESMN